MYHYESPEWKTLLERVRPHTTGYCLRQHTGIDDVSKRGYHIEVWTNKHTIQPLMLTAWQQPNGEWYCQLWDGGPVDFDAQQQKTLEQQEAAAETRKEKLRAEAEELEKEIEALDIDVEYAHHHGSRQDYDSKRTERHRLHQKLTDIYRQLEE